MIKHLVLLYWKEGTTQDQIEAVAKGFSELKKSVPGIIKYEFGPDAGIYKSNADYCLVAEFVSEEDFKIYVGHAKHLQFMDEVVSPVLDSFNAAQFVMDGQ